MPRNERYDIFISYRRRDAWEKAEHLKDLLEPHYKGRISFDRENLYGRFNVRLIERIDAVKDFLIVLGKDSLTYSDEDRDEETVRLYERLTGLPSKEFEREILRLESERKIDYVRVELGRALRRNDLHIIPVVPERSSDFNFSELQLPSDIAAIKGYEAVFYSDNPDALFKDVVPKIRKYLKSRPGNGLAGIFLIAGILLALSCLTTGVLWLSERSRMASCRTENDYVNFQKHSFFHERQCRDSLTMFQFLKNNGMASVNDSDNTSNSTEIAIRWSPDCSLNQLRSLRRLINNMMWVPEGSFTMGTDREEGLSNPVHEVTIPHGYYICKYELTEREWNEIMEDSPEGGTRLPKTEVSWDDAQRLISRLGTLTGLVFNLPSEEQWEYAAGYGYWQKWAYAGGNDPENVAIYELNSAGRKYQTGSKYPNALEIYDMSGNVSEWCSDGEEHKKRIRGGSFLSSESELTITYSDSATRDSRYSTIGIRLILLK
ncbi:MAG: formylglycine-generating enzyme family protein [Candidatus Cryptobacteroides sp.]